MIGRVAVAGALGAALILNSAAGDATKVTLVVAHERLAATWHPSGASAPDAAAVGDARICLPVALRGMTNGPWSWQEPRDSYAVAVSGRWAYLGVGPHLAVVDVAGDEPHIVGSTRGLGSTCYLADIDMCGDLVCALCLREDATAGLDGPKSTLQVIDVSSPARPLVRGSVPIDEYGWSLAAVGAWAYVGGWSFPAWEQTRAGLVVVDLTDPAAPRRHGFLDLGQHVVDQWAGDGRVVAVGSPADGGSEDAAMRVVDVATPSAPRVVGEFQHELFPRDRWLFNVAIQDGIAYSAGHDGRLLLAIDVRTPDRPALLAEMVGLWMRDVAVAGGHLVVLAGTTTTSRVIILQPPEPADMRDGPIEDWSIGRLDLPDIVDTRWRTAGQLAEHGGLVCIARGSPGGLYVVDVRDPQAPRLAGALRFP